MFWRGVIGYLPVNVVQGLVGLGAIMAFTRLLTPAQFGDYALGFSIMSLIHTGLFTWNEAAMARLWAGEADQNGGRAFSATIYGAWGLLLLVLPIAGLIAWFSPLEDGLKRAVLAGLIATLPRTLAKLVQERRRAAGDIRTSALLDMTQTAGGFLIGASLAALGLGGAAPLLGAGVAAAMILPFVLRKERAIARPGTFQLDRARRHAAYGLPVAMSLILALVLATTDRFLLAAYLNPTAVGLYHAGYSLANRTLDVVFIWLGAAGGPALVMALERGGKAAMVKAAQEQASLMLLLTIPAAVGLALVATPLSQLMIGGPLAGGAAHVTPWIALSGLLAGLTTHYFHQAFTLGQRTKLLLAAMLIPAGANLLLNMLLIPRFGLDGALWATPLSYGLGLIASAYLGRRVVSLPIPLLTLLKALAASLVMACIILALPTPGGIWELMLKAGVGAGVYLAIIAALDAGGLRSRGLELLRVYRTRSLA